MLAKERTARRGLARLVSSARWNPPETVLPRALSNRPSRGVQSGAWQLPSLKGQGRVQGSNVPPRAGSLPGVTGTVAALPVAALGSGGGGEPEASAGLPKHQNKEKSECPPLLGFDCEAGSGWLFSFLEVWGALRRPLQPRNALPTPLGPTAATGKAISAPLPQAAR